MSGVEGVPADALLRALAAIDVPITMIDGSGRISFVNAAAEAVVGRTAAELSAVEHFSTIVGIEDRAERAIHHHEVATGGGSARRFRASVERPDGTVAHIGGAMAAVEAGNDGLVLLIGRDVGQEEERDATLGRLAAVCARMPIGVVIWEFVDDPSGTATLRLTTANDAASRAAGVDLASRAGEFVEHVFPDAAAGLLARVAPLRGKEGVLELGDVGHHAPGAPSAVFRRLAVGLPNDSVAVVFEDVTQLRAEDHRRRRDAERLLTVADEERRRIAIGVHDTIVQQLAAAALLVDGMTIRPASPEAGERLAAVSTILRDSQRALRDLLFELSPPELTEGGLAAAVNAAVDYLFARADAAVAVDVTTPPGIPAIVETVAYRIIAEALSNTAKHAHANAVIVRVAPAGRGLVVTVADDGSGFSDPDAARRLDRPGHIGMSAMRQRAASIGGSVDIASGRAGTVVTARLPLDVAADITAGTAPEPPGVLDGSWEAVCAERDGLEQALHLARRREAAVQARGDLALALLEVDDAELIPGLVVDVLADSCAIIRSGQDVLATCGAPIDDAWTPLLDIAAATGQPMLVNGPASTATTVRAAGFGAIAPLPPDRGGIRPVLLAVRAATPYGRADMRLFDAVARRASRLLRAD